MQKQLIKQILSIKAHEGHVWCATWHPLGNLVATCGTDKLVCLWKIKRDEDKQVCSIDKTVIIKLKTQKQTLDGVHTKTVRSVRFSPDGRFLASASFDATIGIWMLIEGEYRHLQTLEGHDNEVKCVAWSDDGKYLASCSRDKTIWIWDYDQSLEFQCTAVLSEHTQDVKYVLWVPGTQRTLLSCGYDDTIRIWKYCDEDWESGESDILRDHKSTVWCMSVSRGGNLMVSCDGSLKVWGNDQLIDNRPYSLVQSIQPIQSQPIYSCSLNFDSHLIATGDGNNRVNVYQMQSQYELIQSMKCDSDVNCVEFSPQHENYLISCGDDELLRLYEIILD